MANSAQDYIDKLYNQSQGVANQLHEQRKQTDDEVIRQINEAIDRATSASVNPYQSQMEQLPAQYQKLYDLNAVQELVGRRQVQEAMANMGLTDSGLNRTQQTALSLQKGNADTSVRLAQQQKTQELQDKINQLLESGAAQKQQQEASVRGNTADWYNTLLSNYYGSAQQQGTSLYNADLERAAAAQEAQRQAALAEAQAKEKAKQQAFENQLAIAKILQGSDAPLDEVRQYLQRGASGTGGAVPIGDTTNTTRFRGSMINQAQSTRWRKQADSYAAYLATHLRDWRNAGDLNDAELAFLLDYYEQQGVDFSGLNL